jgi:hypothetical protein
MNGTRFEITKDLANGVYGWQLVTEADVVLAHASGFSTRVGALAGAEAVGTALGCGLIVDTTDGLGGSDAARSSHR